MATKKAASAKLRKKARALKLNDLYGGGDHGNLLQGRFGTEAVYSWFEKRHRRGYKQLGEDGIYRNGKHSWKVPTTVRLCLSQRLIHVQIANKYPWYVTWVSPKKGRVKKRFNSAWAGIDFIATKAQYVDPHACLVSKCYAYHVPTAARGKFPFKREVRGKTQTWYWCPLCMQPRRFRARKPFTEFFAMKKVWNAEKARYEYRDRKMRLIECTYCGCTNRDSTFRSSNQPFEVRKFKKGVRRAKKRRK